MSPVLNGMRRRVATLVVLLAAMVAGAGEGRQAQIVTLTLDVRHPEGSVAFEQAAAVAEAIGQHSGGRIRITPRHVDMPGGDSELYEAVRLGTSDMALVGDLVFSAVIPEAEFLSQPFLFHDQYQAARVFRQYADGLADKARLLGVHVLAWVEPIPVNLFAGAPVADAEELRGGRIGLAPGNRPLAAAFSALGVETQVLALQDRLRAVEQGALLAGEGTLGDMVADGVANPAVKNVVMTRHQYRFTALCLSNRALQTIPESLRQMLTAGAADGAASAGSVLTQSESMAETILSEAGVAFDEFDGSEFRDALGERRKTMETRLDPDLLRVIEEAEKPVFHM